MMVRIRIKNREFTLSWDEFEKFIRRRTLIAPVEILSIR